VRNTFLPFHVPEIGEDEIQSVVERLRSGWLTSGPMVKEFESQFAGAVNAPQAVAVNSCTAALHLALDAVGIQEGDEVIVPTMTFAATGEVVTYFKAKPVLADCRPDTLCLDVDHVEQLITKKTKAIIPVHFAGHPCDMDRILELAKIHNLRVIEDAAHALPATYRGQMVGSIGDITCFSFYAIKTMTTGEGGMATTRNEEWADRMRIMSLHGISRDAWKRYTSQGSWQYEILSPGFKYNMTDMAAAIGVHQLKKCNRFLDARARYAHSYTESFRGCEEMVLPTTLPDVDHAWHLYVVKLNLDTLRVTRNQFMEVLKKNNVGGSVHFIPLHLHPYYRDTLGYTPDDCPTATAVFDRIVSLPIYPKMSEGDVHDVIDVIHTLLREYRR